MCLAGSWWCPEVVELMNIHIRFHLALKKLVEEFVYIQSLVCKYLDALKIQCIISLIIEREGVCVCVFVQLTL